MTHSLPLLRSAACLTLAAHVASLLPRSAQGSPGLPSRRADDPPRLPHAPITAVQLQARVDAAILAGTGRMEIPGGAYFFNRSDFLIENAAGLQISSPAPVELWFSGAAGVNITSSSDVLLGNWTIDYDPPPTKQETAGSTVNLLNCTRVVCEDVTIRTAPFMAVTAFNGGGAHVFRRLQFVPKPGRTLVGLRDALHFSDQRVGPTVVDSVVGYTGDDVRPFLRPCTSICRLRSHVVQRRVCLDAVLQYSHHAYVGSRMRRELLLAHQPSRLRRSHKHRVRYKQCDVHASPWRRHFVLPMAH